MREMSKWNSLSDTENGVVAAAVVINDNLFPAGPGHFGKEIIGDERLTGAVALADPLDACNDIQNKAVVHGRFAVAKRGQCTFAQKVRNLQAVGASLAIIIDNVEDSTYENTALFAMSGDGKDDIEIPAVFLFSKEGQYLTQSMKSDPFLIVSVGELKALKKQYDSSCDDGNCETVLEAPAISPEKESFDHLKKVLSQLVAQFELSLSNEEAMLQKSCNDDIIEDVYISKDKFTNDEIKKVESKKVCTANSELKVPNESSENILKKKSLEHIPQNKIAADNLKALENRGKTSDFDDKVIKKTESSQDVYKQTEHSDNIAIKIENGHVSSRKTKSPDDVTKKTVSDDNSPEDA